MSPLYHHTSEHPQNRRDTQTCHELVYSFGLASAEEKVEMSISIEKIPKNESICGEKLI